jgi:hypothetical protein
VGKLILVALLTALSSVSLAKQRSNYVAIEVYDQIRRIRPDMNENYRLQLSIEIKMACNKYKIPCQAFTAVLAQESMFRTSAVNMKTLDFGIGQVNRKTAAAHGFCETKLVTERQYSIDAAAQVFAYFYRRFGATESLYWCRYNVGTGDMHLGLARRCADYANKVLRYF